MPAHLARTLELAVTRTMRLRLRRAPALRVAAALRIALFPALAHRMESLDHLAAFLDGPVEHDPFFYLTHKHYLARPLALRERIACAEHHYRHDLARFTDGYRDAVYHGPGLPLWACTIGDTRCELRLRASEDNRYEGDLSVVLLVDGATVTRMAYTVVDGALLHLPPGPVPFIARNQTARSDGLDRFRAAFPQNSPQHFCLAAVSGIAACLGSSWIGAVRAGSQIAYEPRFDTGFVNSYDTL